MPIFAPNVAATSIEIRKAAASIGTRGILNLKEGSNVTLTVADNSASNRVDVTINVASS